MFVVWPQLVQFLSTLLLEQGVRVVGMELLMQLEEVVVGMEGMGQGGGQLVGMRRS